MYYSNAENQLFDLKKDPEELSSISNQALERNLVNELILQLGEHPDDITNRVETYNRNSFIEWKQEQGRAPRAFFRKDEPDGPRSPGEGKDYEENISNLRWEIDFKRNQGKNLRLIENWLSSQTSGCFSDNSYRRARLLAETNDPK